MEFLMYHALVVGDIIDKSFDISVALGLSVGLNLIIGIGFIRLWKFYTNKLEERTQTVLDANKTIVSVNDKIIQVKQDVFDTLKDVVHVLDSLENATKENKDQIIREIDGTRSSIIDKLNNIKISDK